MSELQTCPERGIYSIRNLRTGHAVVTRDPPNMDAPGGQVFICIKNSIACTELYLDEDAEMIAVEVIGMYPEIIGNYRNPNEDICNKVIV
jgi:hypothetical protein